MLLATSQRGLDMCSIIGAKAGGEEDSLSGAFEKEMSQWTKVVGGGPPTKSKGPSRRGSTIVLPLLLSRIFFSARYLLFPLVNNFSQAESASHGTLRDIHPGAENVDGAKEGKRIMWSVEELNGGCSHSTHPG